MDRIGQELPIVGRQATTPSPHILRAEQVIAGNKVGRRTVSTERT
jgi:hypothetical protein